MADDIRKYFEAEAQELIDRLTSGVAGLGHGEDEASGLNDMLRAAHTLKGASHVVGERRMATLAHEFEDAVVRYRAEASEAKADALLRLVDGLAGELAGEMAEEAADELPAAAKVEEKPKVSAARAGVVEAVALRQGQTVRVDIAETRRLLDGVAQSVVLMGSMRGMLLRLEALEGVGTSEMRRAERAGLRQTLGDELDRMSRQMSELYGVASQLRLGSTEGLLLEAGRVVRATAAALGKHAVCVTSGGYERVEMPILEALQDALLHMVRNAVAHGVCDPAERIATGKTPVATIRVEVARAGTEVIFRCADDGKGIALAPIRRVAVERGEMTAAEAAGASPERLLAMLLRPGFSLSGQVDEVSGRGVGLDAVREAAARVRGTVEIRSVEGQGTEFVIRVPQAVFAMQSLEVEAGGQKLEMPLAAVEQTFRMKTHQMQLAERTRTLAVGRETMSFVWLGDVFAGGKGRGSDMSPVCLVVRGGGGERAAIGVERIDGLSEVLVQPVPAFAGIESYVAGTTLSESGEPRLVIDAEHLVRMAIGGNVISRGPADAVSEKARLPILVIDDSLTTRMLEQSILEAEGYEVELATSAEQGLSMARRKAYALFLVDVEMPGMNGFEFVATVSADAQLKGTPAILVTSLDSAEHRERGRAAGAYSYIVKGEFNQQVYLDRIRGVVGGNA